MVSTRALAATVLQLGVMCAMTGAGFGQSDRSSYPVKIKRSNEYKIKKEILKRYDKTTRPVRHDNTTVEVAIALSLYHILDTNEKQQTFTSLLAIRQRWIDEYLTWDPARFNGVDTIRIPANQIWTPDLVISNFAGDKFNDYMVTNTIVSSNGHVLWLYPALIKTYCTLNVQNFPFDRQKCEIIFISWTHSGDQLDVRYNDSFANTVYYIPTNQEWAVDGITAERHVKYYACCKEPYPDVTFTIHMRRGSLFYVVNLIAPCLLIFIISFLGFFLPVESGEKVNLEITILLALVVFLLMVGEMMPPTPDAIPILGMFFCTTMLMVTLALFMAVVVTNIYGKRTSHQPCPRWVVRFASFIYRPCFVLDKSSRSLTDVKPGYNGDCMNDIEMEAFNDHYSFHHRHTSQTLRQLNDTRIEAEWLRVAKAVDRFFFWLFLIISVSIQTAILSAMVNGTNAD